MDSLFCKIVDGAINADIVYQDDEVLAFRDITPRAPTHILIIPKTHIATTNDFSDDNKVRVGHMMVTAARLAAQENLADDGYRLVFNCNRDGGQSVFHVHLHLIGGRSLGWPPG